MVRPVLQIAFLLALLGAALFASAGTVDWPMGWAFLAAFAGFAILAFLVLDPSLIRERSKPGGESKKSDVAIASTGALFLYVLPLVVAGVDRGRYGWSPSLPLAIQIAALGVFAVGYAFGLWAMRVNEFFSTFVRIQDDRGHRVISDGPYAYVRHPGYAGAIVAHLAIPIALGSLLALIPVACGALLFAVRTYREDRTLLAELQGYQDYAARVRSRLVPGIW